MGKTASRIAILCVAGLPACALTGRGPSAHDEAARARSFAAGVSALDQGDFAGAASHLAPVAAICPVDPAGRRAMLLLAAAELDPRNEDGRPDAAAELSAFHITRPDDAESWAAVLATELYALSLDYGAAAIGPEDVPDAGILWSRYLDGAAADGQAGEPIDSDGRGDPDAPPGQARAAVAVVARAEAPRGAGPLCDVPDADRDIALPRLTRDPLVARAQGGRARPTPGAGAEDIRALMAENDRLRAELASKEQELDRIRRTLRP